MSNLNRTLEHLKVVEKILSKNENIVNIPAIEFDIVMSKLRDIYEELLANRDCKIDVERGNESTRVVAIEPIEEVGADSEPAQVEAQEPVFEVSRPEIEWQNPIEDAVETEPEPQIQAVEPIVFEPIEIEEDAEQIVPQPQCEEPKQNVAKTIDPLFDDIDNDIIEQLYGQPSAPKEPEPVVIPQPISEPITQQTVQSPVTTEKRVLGEVLRGDSEVLNSTLGNGAQRDVAAKIVAGADLRTQIGINDRFMFIRELFNNNEKLYEQTLNRLNTETDLNEALIYIGENFRWSGESQAAQRFINLIMKKLS